MFLIPGGEKNILYALLCKENEKKEAFIGWFETLICHFSWMNSQSSTRNNIFVRWVLFLPDSGAAAALAAVFW